MSLFSTLFVALLAVLAATFGPSALRRATAIGALLAGANPAPPLNDERCELVGGAASGDPMVGSEDMSQWRDGVVFVTAGDLRNAFAGTAPAPGAIFAVDLASQAPRHRRLGDLQRAPFVFQPHGLYYSNATNRLLVVSHGLAAGGGSRIVIFNVEGDSFDTLGLVHVRDVMSPAFPNGAINDVVEGAVPGELYVTVWLPCALPAAGSTFPALLRDTWCAVQRGYLQPILPRTHVLRCVFDPAESRSDAADCTVAAAGFYCANGIAKSGDAYFVVDAADDAVAVFHRRVDGSLVRVDSIALPRGVSADNVEATDGAGGLGLIIGANTALQASLAFMRDATRVPVPGAVYAATRGDDGQWAVSRLLSTAGAALPMLSAGAAWGARIAAGSPFSTGVLVCDV